MEKRQLKLGDVFSYGLDKLVILGLPSNPKNKDQLMDYTHVTSEKMTSVSKHGFLSVPEFEQWITTARIKFEQNLFDEPRVFMLVELF